MVRKLLPAAVIAALLFTGCSGSNTASPPAQSPPEQVVETPAPPAPRTWSTEGLNPIDNGNVAYAIELVRGRSGDLANSSVEADVVDVMRRPWDYYGKIISFSGTVAVVQDYPPSDNLSKSFGGETCEIVMSNGDVIIDGILAGTSSGVYVGDWVTFYGYPCGVMDVDNKMGGKFQHLIVIGTR